MILLQIILPAVFVFVIFVVGHFFVSNNGSGLYVVEINFDPETSSFLPLTEKNGEVTSCFLYEKKNSRS